ncbi:MAG: terminase family protein [Magnetococcus sp. THC-1_WYH]
MSDLAKDLICALDPAHFAQNRLGFTPDPWQAQMLQSPSRRIILNCCRQSGKSTTTAILALHTAIFQPNSLTLVISKSDRQSKLLFQKVTGFMKGLTGRPKLDEDNKNAFTLPNGSRVVNLPNNPDSIRGYSAVDLLIEDEAAFVPDALYRSVRPMLAVSNGKLVLMSTPYGKIGHFFEEWTNGSDEWERIKVTAHQCPRITKEFLEEERNSLGSLWFNQEYMGIFAERVDSVFSHDVVMSALSTEVKPLFGEM